MSSRIQELHAELSRELGRVIVGADAAIRALVIALIARGHVLVQGVPGLGKTLLAKSLAHALGGEFKRIQGTPDLMPSDIIGVHVFDERERSFIFRPGPLFADVVLVDEINRAGPKTQAALLEAMEERQVTVDGVTHALPHPFFLVATQNPYETTGTFPLVEGQLDRFSVVTHIGPPDPATERQLLLGEGGEDALADLTSVSDPIGLADAISTVRRIHCAPSVADYVIALANATRHHPEVAIGASPRASLALVHAAQAHALLAGRSYVVPDDVKRLSVPVLAHRLLLRDAATLRDAQTFLSTLVEGVAVPHP